MISSSVTEIDGWSFACCPGLTEITIPASVKILAGHSFEDNPTLEKVVFEGNVENMSPDYSTFQNCPSLASIVVPANMASAYKKKIHKEYHELIREGYIRSF